MKTPEEIKRSLNICMRSDDPWEKKIESLRAMKRNIEMAGMETEV